MVYSKQIADEWGTEVYPLVLRPTMKELQLSKGAIWVNKLSKNGHVLNNMGDRMVRWTGIKPKSTHFKMDLGQKKVSIRELMVIHAHDDDSLNDYSRVVSILAIPVKGTKKKR